MKADSGIMSLPHPGVHACVDAYHTADQALVHHGSVHSQGPHC